MIAWKVTFYDLTSLTIYNDSVIQYKLGKTVKVNPLIQGPMACFRRLKQAIHYTSILGNGRIFKCEVILSKEKALWYLLPQYGIQRTDDLPEGTILCSAVKLLKEVIL